MGERFQKGLIFHDTLDSYYGMGSSPISEEQAEMRARHEFSFNIETRVQNEIMRNVQETNDALRDEYTATARVSSDVVLRGVSITGRYEDKALGQFYALIQIPKSIFDTLLVSEIRRDLERKKGENRINEERKSEELRSRQADLELKRKEEETRRQEIEVESRLYEDFLGLTPPEEVIDLQNGEIARNAVTVILKSSLAPFDVQAAGLKLALWRFELSANTYVLPNRFMKSDMLDREQAALKIQLLDRAGLIYKTSLAFGVAGFSNASNVGALDTVRPQYTVFVGGDVALPDFLYSYASEYVDSRKISLGWNCFPLPGSLKDAVSFVVQMDYIWNKQWRNRFEDPLMIQAGVRFRASDAFATSFAYEGHEYLVLAVEMGF
jgi:LPP20 lipoprotein